MKYQTLRKGYHSKQLELLNDKEYIGYGPSAHSYDKNTDTEILVIIKNTLD